MVSAETQLIRRSRGRPGPLDAATEAAREFRERNALDYAIYREAQARFAEFAASSRPRHSHLTPSRETRTAGSFAAT